MVGPPGEVWQRINVALREGGRGLPGGLTLSQVLVAERAVRKRAYAPGLTVKRILRWADAHHKRTGAWPKSNFGPVSGVPGETWIVIAPALQKGIEVFPNRLWCGCWPIIEAFRTAVPYRGSLYRKSWPGRMLTSNVPANGPPLRLARYKTPPVRHGYALATPSTRVFAVCRAARPCPSSSPESGT